MIKIKYPKNGFKNSYLSVFTKRGLIINNDLNGIVNTALATNAINVDLSLIPLGSRSYISSLNDLVKIEFEKLMISSFEDIMQFAIDFDRMLKLVTNFALEKKSLKNKADLTTSGKFNKEICKELGYGAKWQEFIADFFMSHSDSLKLSTCYYCNMDFINSYNAFAEYKDEKSFVTHVSESELCQVSGISPKAAKIITSQSGKVEGIDELKIITKGQKDSLRLRFRYIDGKGGRINDERDFLRSINKKELGIIKYVAGKNISKILIEKDNVGKIKDLNVSDRCKQALLCWYKSVVAESNTVRYNHFTLDHVMDKMTYPLLSLCLFNFVPSCYSCNSKLKGTKSILNNNPSLSPTSDDFSFNKDVTLRVLYESDKACGVNLNDFKLSFDIQNLNKYEEYKNYIEVFRLPQRYNYHKSEISSLINKTRKYPESQISKIVETLSHADNVMLIPLLHQSVRKDILGKELFEGEVQEKSLTKLKRDIAKQIGIEGVIDG